MHHAKPREHYSCHHCFTHVCAAVFTSSTHRFPYPLLFPTLRRVLAGGRVAGASLVIHAIYLTNLAPTLRNSAP